MTLPPSPPAAPTTLWSPHVWAEPGAAPPGTHQELSDGRTPILLTWHRLQLTGMQKLSPIQHVSIILFLRGHKALKASSTVLTKNNGQLVLLQSNPATPPFQPGWCKVPSHPTEVSDQLKLLLQLPPHPLPKASHITTHMKGVFGFWLLSIPLFPLPQPQCSTVNYSQAPMSSNLCFITKYFSGDFPFASVYSIRELLCDILAH